MSKKTRFILTGISVVIMAVFFALMSPDRMPVIMLLLPFALILVTLYLGLTSALLMITGAVNRFQKATCLTIAITLVLLMLIQSVTQLTIRDVLIATSLCILFVWYFSKSIDNYPLQK